MSRRLACAWHISVSLRAPAQAELVREKIRIHGLASRVHNLYVRLPAYGEHAVSLPENSMERSSVGIQCTSRGAERSPRLHRSLGSTCRHLACEAMSIVSTLWLVMFAMRLTCGAAEAGRWAVKLPQRVVTRRTRARTPGRLHLQLRPVLAYGRRLRVHRVGPDQRPAQDSIGQDFISPDSTSLSA